MNHKHLTYDQRYSIEMMLKAKVQKKIICQTLKIPIKKFNHFFCKKYVKCPISLSNNLLVICDII